MIKLCARIALGAVLVASAAAWAIPSSASAAPETAKAEIPPLIAYGDSQAILPHFGAQMVLSGLPRCLKKPERQRTFPQALDDALRLFKGPAATGKKRLNAFKYSGTPGRADVFAAGAAMAGAPLAGLAALLDAEHRARRDPMVLVNASVLLTDLGHPADGLAFINRARALGHPKGAPLGLSSTAVMLNDRGLALVAMGRYAEALTSLQAAIRAGGRLLSEAESNAAEAYDCTGRKGQAVAAVFASAYRQNYDLVDDNGTTTGPGVEQQPTPQNLGFTRPVSPPEDVPVLKYPATVEQAAAAHNGFQSLTNYLINLSLSLGRKVTSMYVKLFDQLRHVSPVTRRRTEEILLLSEQLYPDAPEPALAETNNALNKAFADINDFMDQFTGQAPPLPCGHQGQWLSLMQTLDTKLRDFVAALGKYEAPLVANLGNPLAHEIAVDEIRSYIDTDVAVMLAGTVAFWSGILTAPNHASCVNPTSYPSPGHKDTKVGDPGECPPSVGVQSKLVIEVPKFVALKVDCESVEVSVEGENIVAPFVSGEVRRDEVSVFGGAKVGAKVGPFGGELQEGFYVKTGPNGVEDWGFRVAPSGSVGGTVSVEYGDSVDISLVGVIDYIPTAFGFN